MEWFLNVFLRAKMDWKEGGKVEVPEDVERVAREFTRRVLDRYGGLVKCVVMMGSVVRGEFRPKSDIDIFVVLDDVTYGLDEKRVEKINEEMEEIARGISERISLHPCHTLTEFWDYARVGHPVIYNFIREGIALYDTGFFTPIKRLLEMGKIPTTREAVEKYMENAPKRLMRARTVKLLILAEDCYYAILNTAQAVLMFMGLPPPVPSKAYQEVRKHLVEPGILEPQYAEWLKEIIEIRKKIEHRELTEVSGAFVDLWLDRAEKFVNKMFALLSVLKTEKTKNILKRTHEVMYKAMLTALKNLEVPVGKAEEIPSLFKKELIDTGRIDRYYWGVWNRIEELKKKLDEGKIEEIDEEEVLYLREAVRRLIRDLTKVLKEEKKNK
ncbi:MAG: nucleotidyltransferase [Thermoprotei archaeon]|nr:MAG: nucleotidyltransferase [Desulfurococcales archaeon ex4484_217_2]RLG74045.1 MAG: nucleotidyltransferase [Thermoprotei archaeon]